MGLVWNRRSSGIAATGAVALIAAVTMAAPAASQQMPAAASSQPAAVAEGAAAPSQWPSSELASFGLEGWPNAVRVHGANILENSAAAALMGRGSGQFPYESPDRTGGASSLADAAHWWGTGVCPKSVIVVAGDVPADAMSASALSDPTGGSSEPWLRRVAAADPLFDPVGGFSKVDTYAAPILFVQSARAGASALPLSTRLVAADLRSGGCTAARQAVIVGGSAAVSAEIEAELVAHGYAEVFRVAGADRYGTAAAVARALGTAAVPSDADGCVDPGGDGPDQLAFHANSVVEYRARPGHCELLGRTVVLADGVEGIDAVAAGWWTSRWQVPVLLHDGSDRLPRSTAEALSVLLIDHVVVLGGGARIPTPVVRQAERLAGAQAIRVAGPNRYSTSVEMARHFGGWFADEAPGGFSGALVCVASSSGTGATALGWADALTAGPWCGTAGALGTVPPERMIGPVTVPLPASVGGAASEHSSVHSDLLRGSARRPPTGPAVPLLLLPARGVELPPSVDQYLKALFRVPTSCSALVGRGAAGGLGDATAYSRALRSGACPEPGFAVAFGRPEVLADDTLGTLSAMLSAGLTGTEAPQPLLVGAETPDETEAFGISTVRGVPLGTGAFATTLAMSPVYRHTVAVGSGGTAESSASEAAPVRVCAPRGSYGQARWLIAETGADRSPVTTVELPSAGWYLADADGTQRSSGLGTPSCLQAAVPTGSPLLVRAVSSAGRTTRSLMVSAAAERRMSLDGAVRALWPETSGVRSDRPLDSGVIRWEFATGPLGTVAWLADEQAAVTATRLVVSLRRRASDDDGAVERPVTFTAEWSVRTERGRLSGTAAGEALFAAGRWELRGFTVLRSGSWASAALGPPGRAATPAGQAGGSQADSEAQTGDAAEFVTPLRAGTADGYGAGGFTATINVNGAGNHNDTIRWQPEVFLNTTP